MLGVGVQGDRSLGRLADHFGDERDPRAATDEQDAVHPAEAQAGASRGTIQGEDRLPDPRPDHRLELLAGEPDVGLDPGQGHGDGGVGVRRQALLGPTALLAQPGHAGQGRGVVRVEHDAGRPDGRHHVGEDGLVEVDPAEALHALGAAELLEALLGLAQDRGVERAPAEVVHGDHLAGRDPLLEGVVERGGLGLGDQLDRPDVGLADRLAQEVDLVLAVARRVTDRDGRRLCAHLDGDPADDAAQEVADQRLGAVRRPTQDDRRGVAQAALEFAGRPDGLRERPALRGIPDQDLAIGPQDDDRRDGGRPLAQLEDLEAIATRGRSR